MHNIYSCVNDNSSIEGFQNEGIWNVYKQIHNQSVIKPRYISFGDFWIQNVHITAKTQRGIGGI